MLLLKMLDCLQAVGDGLQGIYKLKTTATPGGLDMTVGIHCAVTGPQLPIMLSDVCRLLCLSHPVSSLHPISPPPCLMSIVSDLSGMAQRCDGVKLAANSCM